MIESFKDEYEWLSNFYPIDIKFFHRTYPSVEHAYMSAKSNDNIWKSRCQNRSITPGKIKRLSKGITLVDDWNEKKLTIMEFLIDKKFDDPYLKEKLLATNDLHIQEGNTWNDKYWGVCLKTGEGENNLGKLIMNKRNELRYE